MSKFWNTTLLSVALFAPIMMTPSAMRADDRRYHDKRHNDDHEWNDHEDRAYREWARQNRRQYRPFEELRESDRQRYWGWRHSHSDAILHIDIR